MNRNTLLFIGLAAVILTVLFVVLSPDEPAAPEVAAERAPAAFAFTLRDGRKTSGPAVMEVAQGTEVRLVVNADQDDELHVHGYDIARDLPAGETVDLAFEANRSGRFVIELHGSHLELSVLQVQPR